MHTHGTTDPLESFRELFPSEYRDRLEELNHEDSLVEVVLDVGRAPVARYIDREIAIVAEPVTRELLTQIEAKLGKFGDDNRAGISGTLHRIAALRNRNEEIVGLSCRIGRSVPGTSAMLDEFVRSGKSILVVGRPGRGKTTLLRDMARVLADEEHKRVMIVDTSNEIAGDGDTPHPAIGSARRIQVPKTVQQHAKMIEAVENHMPEYLVIDEIGTVEEAAAARTIAERGVGLIATAHGTNLRNVLLNPTLSDLVGGIEVVTLGDDEARNRGTTKTVQERRGQPTFDICIEIEDWQTFVIHREVARTVDALLLGNPAVAERRYLAPDGAVRREKVESEPIADVEEAAPRHIATASGRRRSGGAYEEWASGNGPDIAIFAPDINPRHLMAAIREAGLSARLVHRLDEATAMIMLADSRKKLRGVIIKAEAADVPVITLRTDSVRDCRSAVLRAQKAA